MPCGDEPSGRGWRGERTRNGLSRNLPHRCYSQLAFSTWLYSSSTGVARPKILIATFQDRAPLIHFFNDTVEAGEVAVGDANGLADLVGNGRARIFRILFHLPHDAKDFRFGGPAADARLIPESP